jgi:AcrR family transcriptional regulator
MLTYNELYNPTDDRVFNILVSAEKHFRMHGFRKASIDAICNDAGISKPTFYKYFESKETLFFGVRIYAMRSFDEAYERAFQICTSATEKLHLYFKMLDEYACSEKSFVETFDYNRELRNHWKVHPLSIDSRQHRREFVERIIVDGIAKGELRNDDATVIAHKVILMTALLGILRRNPPQFLGKNQSIADLVFDLLMDGIRNTSRT